MRFIDPLRLELRRVRYERDQLQDRLDAQSHQIRQLQLEKDQIKSALMIEINFWKIKYEGTRRYLRNKPIENDGPPAGYVPVKPPKLLSVRICLMPSCGKNFLPKHKAERICNECKNAGNIENDI